MHSGIAPWARGIDPSGVSFLLRFFLERKSQRRILHEAAEQRWKVDIAITADPSSNPKQRFMDVYAIFGTLTTFLSPEPAASCCYLLPLRLWAVLRRHPSSSIIPIWSGPPSSWSRPSWTAWPPWDLALKFPFWVLAIYDCWVVWKLYFSIGNDPLNWRIFFRGV